MKILIIRTYPDILNIDSYNVQEIGLAKALVRKGHICDIVLYNGNKKTECKEYKFSDGDKEYIYHIFWCRGYNLLKMGIMPDVPKLIDNYDVIQVHEYEQLLSWKLYRKQKKPTVIYHGLYASDYTKGYNLKCKVFDNTFFRFGSHKKVVCITKSELAADFLKSKGFERVYGLGVGLDESRFKPIEKQHSFDRNKQFRLLYVGKIEDRRNSLFLIDILEELIRRGHDVSMKVVGSGDKQYVDEFLKKSENLRARGILSYVTKETQEEIALEYVNSDAFLFPSKYEIFGMVLLETMYFGCPVISSYNGGSSVLIKNDEMGIIVDSFNSIDWADAVERILCDRNKAIELGFSARKVVNEQFLWDTLAKKFLNVYQEAVNITLL